MGFVCAALGSLWVTVVTRGHYDVRGQKKMSSDADEDSNRHIVEYDDGTANHFADEAYA